MNDICALIGHSPAMYGICSICGVQTYVMPVPTKSISLEEAKERWPASDEKASVSANTTPSGGNEGR